MNFSLLPSLVLREYWEHRGLLVKTPMVISIILIILTSIGTYQAVSFAPWSSDKDSIQYEHSDGSSFKFDPDDAQEWGWQSYLNDDKQHISNAPATIASGIVAVAMGISFLLSLFYLSQALYQDRRDRSVLFWRSLPINEWQTILSKLVTGMWVFPIVFSSFALVATLICLLIVYIGASVLGIESVMNKLIFEIEAYSFVAFLRTFLEEVIIITSLLPVYCWFLFSSAFSKKSPMLVAIGVPIAIIIAEGIVLHSRGGIDAIKSFFMTLHYNASALSYFNFTSVNWGFFILIAVISSTLLAATFWLRNHRYEM